jgi:Ca2+-binding RTX toxin-like protein
MAVIVGTDSGETLSGGGDDDIITGTGGDDVLSGLDGSDQLDGGAGSDQIYGGLGDDYLMGEGILSLSELASSGGDTLDGGDGADFLFGGAGNDVLLGGAGDDVILTPGGHASPMGYGVQTTSWDWGVDTIDGGAGDDDLAYLDFNSATAPVTFTLGNPSQVSTVFINGVAGATVTGVEHVTVLGGSGADHITGGANWDTLLGNQGADTLEGGDGADYLNGGQDHDTLVGGGGDDTYIITDDDIVVEEVDGGYDRLIVQVAYQAVFDLHDYANVEGLEYYGVVGLQVTAGEGGASIWTGAGDDLIVGGAGNDVLIGGAGADVLKGGDGNDSLDGRTGFDRLEGGLGDDNYVFYEDLPDGALIVENVGEGVDSLTIYAYSAGAFDLADAANVENLYISDIGAFTATGTEDDNIIEGASGLGGVYHFSGGGGDDTLTGAISNDVLLGEGGDDTLSGNAGDDELRGGDGADIVLGGGGDDTLYGDDGDDFMDGGRGSDLIEGGAGDDRLFGDSSYLVSPDPDAAASSDHLVGGDGDDELSGGGGADHLEGGDGDDVLHPAGASSIIDGGAGIDTVDFGVIFSNDPAQNLVAVVLDLTDPANNTGAVAGAQFISIEKFVGADGADTFTGAGGVDQFYGGYGDDTLNGRGGNDRLYGGQGADTLNGGDGADFLAGELGDDLMYGGAGLDLLVAGDGNDLLDGGSGDERAPRIIVNATTGLETSINGGDIAAFNEQTDPLTVDLSIVGPQFTGHSTVTLVGIEDLWGGNGADILRGDLGANELVGAGGDDQLFGGGGDDLLIGEAGADTLWGGEGNDVLRGGGVGSGDQGPEGAANILHGGAGADTLTGSGSGDLLYGEDGDDHLYSTGQDRLLGGEGGDDIHGALGNLDIDGGGGGDLIRVAAIGQGQNQRLDVILAGTGDDYVSLDFDLASLEKTLTIDGGDGVDVLDLRRLTGVSGPVTIDISGAVHIGGLVLENIEVVITGVNTVIPSASAVVTVISGVSGDQVFGSPGDDVLFADPSLPGPGVSSDDRLYGGPGNDVLFGGAGRDGLLGGPGDDVINLTGGPLAGDPGWALPQYWSDQISGDAGYDVANLNYADANVALTFTLEAPDQFSAVRVGGMIAADLYGIEAVSFFSGSGDDVLTGGASSDRLSSGGGQDWLNGADGADSLSGGEGQDSVWGGAGDDLLDGGAGDDTLYGGAGRDTASYASAHGRVEIDLSIVEDQLTRGAGVDTLISIESLVGSDFDDRLTGDAGANVITGGLGADILAGGAGNDVFVFTSVADSPSSARDLILDFALGDKIDLSAIDANIGLPGDQAFHGASLEPVGTVSARYDGVGDRTAIELFIDADASADAVIWLVGDQRLALDFIL